MKILTSRYCEGVTAADGISVLTDGLVRDRCKEKLRFYGYVTIEGDLGNKLTLITLEDDSGNVFNLATKSDNLVERLDDVIDLLEGNGDFGVRKIQFGKAKTRSGNECLTVAIVPEFRVKARALEEHITE